ncbi:plasmid-partitioning protein, partial [Klebsiella pneumoniae]|nr:plasmid-partitioning protein [Klebsiella pneumoniae]
KAGLIFDAEDLIILLTYLLKQSKSSIVNLSSLHHFATVETALYLCYKMVLNLDKSRIPADFIEKIEAFLKDLELPV